MEMIKAIDVNFNYKKEFDDEDKTTALNGINLTIKPGEFVVIIGHNGSGKSTLAKHFNAILVPSSGDVIVKNMNTKDASLIWDIRKSVGMVFQNPDNQIVATIVEEDVAFGPENLGVEPAEIRKRVDEVLETVEMLEYAKHGPHLLSGGQKQRVAIAGVLAMKPSCIVLDEPTAMLDPSGRREVINTIKKLNKEEKITIILITHFMEEAVDADRVVIVSDGKIVMDDSPREVFKKVKELKSLGLDVPQVTQLAFELKNEGIDIKDNILTIEEMVDALCRLK
ncbi:Energy-coupling factor transporter ATP-binding protein EcfA1 [Caloramator mitchellensis]|uniref:Energy-coupling factor transporter ATP-binding protein EcfA1 n=1 Tax=Caloramator mitchellensis TaxID=908809 RepID=A0A0R3K1I9_CALMK|nr:energy-coupling factor transporter ATPase [Caloramator mitchellensis]KRQ87268.1 Energy-coupling factor transporter ATP-binding protein EcfA1 [Caloramator mitchellensis]